MRSVLVPHALIVCLVLGPAQPEPETSRSPAPEPSQAEEPQSSVPEPPTPTPDQPSPGSIPEPQPPAPQDEPPSLDDDPAGLDDEPAGLDDEPAGLDDEPAGLDDEPAGLDDEPAGLDDEPAGLDDEPAGLDDEPGLDGEAPGLDIEPDLGADPIYDPLRDSPEAMQARRRITGGIILLSAGTVLIVSAIGMAASDPCARLAGNSCSEDSRARAARTIAVPGALMTAGGAALLGVGLHQRKRLRASVYGGPTAFGIHLTGRF